mmetsp:Transcript_12421/g.35528  ORF Transcript_12421/g.35528 Transcript_12421/m.35528 type:complete len:315 (-) Transcript_12421:90-1034(-)
MLVNPPDCDFGFSGLASRVSCWKSLSLYAKPVATNHRTLGLRSSVACHIFMANMAIHVCAFMASSVLRWLSSFPKTKMNSRRCANLSTFTTPSIWFKKATAMMMASKNVWAARCLSEAMMNLIMKASMPTRPKHNVRTRYSNKWWTLLDRLANLTDAIKDGTKMFGVTKCKDFMALKEPRSGTTSQKIFATPCHFVISSSEMQSWANMMPFARLKASMSSSMMANKTFGESRFPPMKLPMTKLARRNLELSSASTTASSVSRRACTFGWMIVLRFSVKNTMERPAQKKRSRVSNFFTSLQPPSSAILMPPKNFL